MNMSVTSDAAPVHSCRLHHCILTTTSRW